MILRTTKKRPSGFTLIELMIVVVIMAILALIAYPAYRDQIRSARRADGQQALMALAAAMERHHSENLAYTGAGSGGSGNTGAPTIFPAEAPLDGDQKYYDLLIDSASVDDYTLQAQPKGGQAGDGVLQLQADGTRGWDRDNSGGIEASEQCWKRKC